MSYQQYHRMVIERHAKMAFGCTVLMVMYVAVLMFTEFYLWYPHFSLVASVVVAILYSLSVGRSAAIINHHLGHI